MKASVARAVSGTPAVTDRLLKRRTGSRNEAWGEVVERQSEQFVKAAGIGRLPAARREHAVAFLSLIHK